MTHSRRAGLAAAGLLLVVALATAATGVSGADPDTINLIRRVDSTDPANTRLQFLYTGAESDVAGAKLSENGVAVDMGAPQRLPATTKIAVAMVFDTSAAADTSGTLVSAKDAAKSWVRGRSAAQKDAQVMAIYAASSKGLMIQDFTSNEQRLLSAIDRVAPTSDPSAENDTALWSAIKLAATGLGDQGGYQGNLVVMTAQGDTASGSDETAARGRVATSRAAVFAVGYTGGKGFNTAPLQSLVNANGAEMLTTTDANAVGGLVSSVDSTISDQQYQILYPSTVELGAVANIELAVGATKSQATVVVGGNTEGKQALAPRATTSSGGIAFLQSGLGLMLTILMVLVAVAGLAYALTLIFVKDDELTSVLQPYSESYGEQTEDEDGRSSLTKTAFVQRAVELTEQVAESRGVLTRAEGALERANLPLRAGEALFFYAALVVVVTILGLVVTGNLFGGLILGLIAALLPMAIVSFLAGRRRKAFLAQLPDTLQLLSGTLRAGYSLMQGVEAVSQEVAEPMGLELRRVVTESRLGRPLEEALEGTAARMDSPDFGWAVMAIRIQREVGGNLSELLLTVAETMTARERLRRDVAALTAEGRMSAIVLGALPILLGGAMFVINREYTSKLFTTTLGNILLGVSLVSIVIGFFWMKKIIDIEI